MSASTPRHLRKAFLGRPKRVIAQTVRCLRQRFLRGGLRIVAMFEGVSEARRRARGHARLTIDFRKHGVILKERGRRPHRFPHRRLAKNSLDSAATSSAARAVAATEYAPIETDERGNKRRRTRLPQFKVRCHCRRPNFQGRQRRLAPDLASELLSGRRLRCWPLMRS